MMFSTMYTNVFAKKYWVESKVHFLLMEDTSVNRTDVFLPSFSLPKKVHHPTGEACQDVHWAVMRGQRQKR